MTIALSEFWTNLVHAGIVAAEDCKRIATQCSRANQGRIVSDPVLVAKFMIQTGQLTEFQARSLLSKPPKAIRFGKFLQRSDSAIPPLSQWIDVQSIDDRTDGWLSRIPASQIDPSNRQWLADHQRVVAAGLQPIRCSASTPETIDIFSALPPGHCLFELLSTQVKIDPRRTFEIGIQIAQSLTILHDQGLVHGGVRADRVWVSDSGQAILLREPIRWSMIPRTFSGGPQLDDLELAAAYAAPELAQSALSCDPLTDIYSVGCLMFRMMTGRTPFNAKSPHVLMAAHAHETPPELADAVSHGAAGDPCFRVIAFAMAKNREARFASASQLSDALQAVLPLLNQDAINAAAPDAGRKRRKKGVRADQTELPKEQPTAKTKQTKKTKKVPPAKPVDDPKPTTRTPPEPPPVGPAIADTSETPLPRKSVVASVASETTQASAPVPAPSSDEPSAQLSDKPPAAALPPEPSTAQTPPTVPTSPPTKSPSPAPAPQRRRRKKKKSAAPLILGGLGIAALLLVVAVLVYEPSEPEKKNSTWRPAPTVIPSVGGGGVPDLAAADTSTQNLPDVAAQGPYQVIDDDRLLFVPPVGHDEERAPIELLPPGPGMIVSARLASLRQSTGGASIATALGSDLETLLGIAESRAGVKVDEIERCTAALHAGKEGWPSVSLVIELVRPLPLKELLERWQVSASRTPEGATVYSGDELEGDAFFVDGGEAGKVASEANVSRFAVGSVSRMREVAELNGAAIPLAQAMEKLWRTSSGRADVFALITPNFLLADARSMVQATMPQLIGPLKDFLIPDVSSAQLLATLDDDRTYVELRMVPSGGVTDAALRERFRRTMQAWPKWADDFVVDSVPDSSWRLLAIRLPSMMRFLVDHTRDGLADSTVVANAYLPSQGAAQLSLATLLAMNAPRGPAVGAAKPVENAEQLTVSQMLDRKMSVSFDQESLEFAVNTIVEEFQRSLPQGAVLPPVKIIGGDLQLMGITQNQQIRDFAKTDVPLRQVLTDLVVGANPDKTATGPTDPKQALLWVVVEDGDIDGQTQILITTRSAAEGKYEIPAEFVSP